MYIYVTKCHKEAKNDQVVGVCVLSNISVAIEAQSRSKNITFIKFSPNKSNPSMI